MQISKRDKAVLRRIGASAAREYSATLTPEQRKERARKAGIASGAARARKAKEGK